MPSATASVTMRGMWACIGAALGRSVAFSMPMRCRKFRRLRGRPRVTNARAPPWGATRLALLDDLRRSADDRGGKRHADLARLFWLTISSSRATVSTGTSAGFAPLSNRSVSAAARRVASRKLVP